MSARSGPAEAGEGLPRGAVRLAPRWADAVSAKGSTRSVPRDAETGAIAYRRAFRCRSSPLANAGRNDVLREGFSHRRGTSRTGCAHRNDVVRHPRSWHRNDLMRHAERCHRTRHPPGTERSRPVLHGVRVGAFASRRPPVSAGSFQITPSRGLLCRPGAPGPAGGRRCFSVLGTPGFR